MSHVYNWENSIIRGNSKNNGFEGNTLALCSRKSNEAKKLKPSGELGKQEISSEQRELGGGLEHFSMHRSLRNMASALNELENHWTFLNKVTYVTLLKEYLWLVLSDKLGLETMLRIELCLPKRYRSLNSQCL